MEHAPSVIVIAIAAFLLPLFADRLRVPAVVLEIVFGIVVGPSILNWTSESEVIATLAEIGFFLLMFLSGFEIDFRRLERQGALQSAVGVSTFAVTLFLAYLASHRLGHGAFVTLLLATTSVGLVVPTLRNTQRANTKLGQAILVAALLADFLTLIGATLTAMIAEQGLGWNLLRLPVLFLAIALVLVALKRLAWWFPERFERLFDLHDPEELGIRATLALMFVFVGLSYLLQIEAILGAFLAGTVFALVFRHRGPLEQKLSGFSFGFLIPIFFIHVGLRFDLQELAEPGVALKALELLGIAVLIKVVAALPLLVLGLSPKGVFAAGILLSTRLSLLIAVAELGARLGLLSHALESEVILIAVVTSTLCPAIFRFLMPRPPAPA